MTKARRLLLGLVVALGLAARIVAVPANELPHGDVHLDLLTLDAFLAGSSLRTPIERCVDLYPPVDAAPGYPLDQHPPLALLVAAALAPLAPTPYAALQLASLLEGILLIGAAWLLGRRLQDADAGALAAALVAGSFLLADFAGNGAIYSLQALLTLLAVAALTFPGPAGTFACGIACGLAWLTNYQAAVLLPAAVLAIVLARRRETFRPEGLAALLALGAGFLAAALPWWVRNVLVFGDPTFTVNPLYLRYRLGAEPALIAVDGRTRLVLLGPELPVLLQSLASNLVVNVRFVAVQAPLWLATVLGAGLAGAGIAAVRGFRARRAAPLALATVTVVQLAALFAWPACKFRYLVPPAALLGVAAALACRERAPRGVVRLLGLVGIGILAVAAERLLRGHPRDGLIAAAAGGLFVLLPALRLRRGTLPAVAVLVPFLLMQVVLAAASATRTTYYDGVLAADAFGRTGAEAADRARQAGLARVAAVLLRRGVAGVVGPVELKTYAGASLTVVQPPPVADAAALLRALRRTGARHVLARSADEEAFLTTVPGFAGIIHRERIGDETLTLAEIVP